MALVTWPWMLAGAACASKFNGRAIAKIASSETARTLLTFNPIRFIALFSPGPSLRAYILTLFSCAQLNLMLNSPSHTVWDRPLRRREMPEAAERSFRRRRRLQSHRNSKTNLHGTVRRVQLPAGRSRSSAWQSAVLRPEYRPLWSPFLLIG